MVVDKLEAQHGKLKPNLGIILLRQFWDFMKPLLCNWNCQTHIKNPVHTVTEPPAQRLRPQMFRDTSIERMCIMYTDEIWTHKCSRMHTWNRCQMYVIPWRIYVCAWRMLHW
jgi:hypothetical protein